MEREQAVKISNLVATIEVLEDFAEDLNFYCDNYFKDTDETVIADLKKDFLNRIDQVRYEYTKKLQDL